MNKDLGDIKTFLKSEDPEKLTDMMLANNIKTRCYHDYRIVFDGKFWFAWFEMDLNDLINEKMNDVRNGKGQ